MSFAEAVRTCFGKYATFAGRASRSEFWYFQLFSLLVNIVAGIIDAALFPAAEIFNGPLGWIATVVLFVPDIAVGCRRLHDSEKSGWLQLIALTIVGAIPLVIWLATPGSTGDNRYGADPLKTRAAALTA